MDNCQLLLLSCEPCMTSLKVSEIQNVMKLIRIYTTLVHTERNKTQKRFWTRLRLLIDSLLCRLFQEPHCSDGCVKGRILAETSFLYYFSLSLLDSFKNVDNQKVIPSILKQTFWIKHIYSWLEHKRHEDKKEKKTINQINYLVKVNYQCLILNCCA